MTVCRQRRNPMNGHTAISDTLLDLDMPVPTLLGLDRTIDPDPRRTTGLD